MHDLVKKQQLLILIKPWGFMILTHRKMVLLIFLFRRVIVFLLKVLTMVLYFIWFVKSLTMPLTLYHRKALTLCHYEQTRKFDTQCDKRRLSDAICSFHGGS